MAFSFAPSPDAFILLVVEDVGTDLLKDLPGFLPTLTERIVTQPQPVCLILDLPYTNLRLDQLNQLMRMLAHDKDSILHHPNIRGTVIATRSEAVQMAASVVNGPLFDHLHVSIANTRAEAVAHCQALLGLRSVSG